MVHTLLYAAKIKCLIFRPLNQPSQTITMKTLLIFISLLIPIFGFTQDAKLPEHITHNDFCSGEEEENCYYLHGERQHTCTDKCKEDDGLVDHKHNEVCYEGEDQCSFSHGERGHDCEHRRCNLKGDGREHAHNDSCRPYECHYAHGEIRHICTDYCATLADHEHNDLCKAKACHFEHGEKGHTCVQECYNKQDERGHEEDDHEH